MARLTITVEHERMEKPIVIIDFYTDRSAPESNTIIHPLKGLPRQTRCNTLSEALKEAVLVDVMGGLPEHIR